MPPLFTGLSAFPLTPADTDGVVDVALSVLLDRLSEAEVDSIGLLDSTGAYAYLDCSQRQRAVEAAVETVSGRIPLIVGVGALRTDWAQELARGAERAGADGLLLAPMSYTPLTPGEVAEHYDAVTGATGLPLCIYNNPGTTHFTFSLDLLAEIAALPRVAAVKMPLPADGDVVGEIARLREHTPSGFSVGYSGDWGLGSSMLAGSDAFYSALAGVLPAPMLRLMRAAQAGETDEVARLEWRSRRRGGSSERMAGCGSSTRSPISWDRGSATLRHRSGVSARMSSSRSKRLWKACWS